MWPHWAHKSSHLSQKYIHGASKWPYLVSRFHVIMPMNNFICITALNRSNCAFEGSIEGFDLSLFDLILLHWALNNFILSQSILFGQQTQRGQSPVEHRGNLYVCMYVRLYICTFPTEACASLQGLNQPLEAWACLWEASASLFEAGARMWES